MFIRRSRTVALVLAGLILSVSHTVSGLDKQGSAHAGAVEGPSSGISLSGAATLGISFYNPTYAARPNNTGRALMRYALHADLDLIGRRLSIPIDFNLFTDRLQRGLRKFVPSEFDIITGFTTTWQVPLGALEFGARVEHDANVDKGAPDTVPPESDPAYTQTYVDVRARFLYSVAHEAPSIRPTLADGDISGWLTLGWFALNPTYAARPDNTGLALLRYAAHTELSVLRDHVSLGLDATMFTSRCSGNLLRPTELDFTTEIIGRIAPYELHIAYERDMPTDGGGQRDTCGVPTITPGIVQSFAYLLFAYEFGLGEPMPPPLETRSNVVSRTGDASASAR